MSYATMAGNGIPSGEEIVAAIVASSIPAGPTPTLSTDAPSPEPGAIIQASWTNTSGTLRPQFRWLKNGVEHSADNSIPPGGTASSFDTTGMSSGDTFTGQIRYMRPADGLIGSGVVNNNQQMTAKEINDGLVLTSSIPEGTAGNRTMATKDEIEARQPASGDYGAVSNGITLF